MGKRERVSLFTFLTVSVLGLFLFNAYSQPAPLQAPQQGDLSLPAMIGALRFRIKTIEVIPASLTILEMEVEINNTSPNTMIPAGQVKVKVTPLEILPSSLKSDGRYDPPHEEAFLNLPIPPRGSQSLLFGFSLPPEKLESISFEVQINPPGGEKKTVTYQAP